MPDLNSLPPSPAPPAPQSRPYGNSSEAQQRSPSSSSPRSSSVSLAAAASINAGIQHEESRRSSTSSNRNRPSQTSSRNDRTRANVAMNLNLNDPALPAAGELQTGDLSGSTGHTLRTTSPRSVGSPVMPQHYQRAPSLGELHQELEQEQEAQVNRLLELIRQQQVQLQQIQQHAGYTPSTSTAVIDDSTQATPTSERSFSFPSVPGGHAYPRSPAPRNSAELSRQSSRRSHPPSRTTSPSLPPQSAGLGPQGEELSLPGAARSSRDEAAYYQAETQALTRENQMLRVRIRHLEQQLSSEGSPGSAHTPITQSNLTAAPIDLVSASSAPAASAEESDDKE